MEDLKKQIDSIVNIYKTGNLPKAELLCKDLLKKNSKIVFLYNLLGLILVEQKKIDEAIECYQKGISIDPKFAMIYNNLGLLYTNNKSDYVKGENYYKKSISLNQNLPETHNNLGSLYKSQDKFTEAIKCFEKSIEINRNFVHAYHNLGNVYITLGKFEEAKSFLLKAIKINPNYSLSHRSLSRIIKYNDKDDHFKVLKETYKKISNSDIENKTNISFALGKAYEDIGEQDKSFILYKEANALYKNTANFSIQIEKSKCEKIKDVFNKNLFEKYKDSGKINATPIFILGMPRSGTTLIEQILSNHPKVFGGDERFFIIELLQKYFQKKDLRLFFENVLEFDSKTFNKIGEDYINKMNEISKKSIITTDKMPENFFWIGFIKLILPNSKIVHCYRNSKDNCLSIFKNHFPGGKISYSYDLENIVNYYNLYLNLMQHWNKILPNFVFNIKYENVISNTKKEIESLLSFCQLDWHEDCLNFYKNKRAVKTASDVQARSKIYKTSIDSWKKYEKYLSPHFDKLNN